MSATIRKFQWLLYAAAGGAVLSFLATVAARSGEIQGLPNRVTAIEKSQSEITRRVDTLTSDIGSMRRDMEADSKRTESSFLTLKASLAELTGVMRDLRDQGIKAQSDLAGIKEKAANAAVLADDAARAVTEAKARIETHLSEKGKQ